MGRKQGLDVEFDAFVKGEQAAAAQGKEIDWAREREEWLGYLAELYVKVESFLAEYIPHEITVTYRDIDLNEENIGSYKARQMVLKIGRQEITLTPVGTLIVGMKGRVDIVGRAGQARLVLVDDRSSGPIRVNVSIGSGFVPRAVEPAREKIKWAWKIATRPPTVRYMELTQESLRQILMEVANG
jgi:hypothetical protein